MLMEGLAGPGDRGVTDTQQYEKLRAAVNDKSFTHQQDYRMLNGWYVYGGRRTFDTESFPREYVKLRNMAAVRDRYAWDIAQGKPVADKPDDSRTGELIVPSTPPAMTSPAPSATAFRAAPCKPSPSSNWTSPSMPAAPSACSIASASPTDPPPRLMRICAFTCP